MGKQRMKKALSVALSASMAIGALASVQPFPAVAAVTSGIVTRLADDMVVANSVYGWVTEDAAENSDHTISIRISRTNQRGRVYHSSEIRLFERHDESISGRKHCQPVYERQFC